MIQHPYQALDDSAYWKRAVANISPEQLDPVTSFPFAITPTERIATAGSCFAQHLSRRLQLAGFNYYVTEPAPLFFPEDMAYESGYGMFTARYGNIYTCRQLLQLYQRAYGEFTPEENSWRDNDGNRVDPFRPRIQPGGFATLDELLLDREQHLEAVRTAFETLDVFVFTLGLTEAWVVKGDGSVFPLCPGVAGGQFDDKKYQFTNFSVQENTADLLAFIDVLRQVNPAARVILTVSPVPLVATYEKQHVLLSTTYSKSVLRVTCEQVVQARPQVAYFPSYEIITGHYNRGRYFAEDLRSVTEDGVGHVMRVFMKHCTTGGDSQGLMPVAPPKDHFAETAALVEALCDEEVLDAGR